LGRIEAGKHVSQRPSVHVDHVQAGGLFDSIRSLDPKALKLRSFLIMPPGRPKGAKNHKTLEREKAKKIATARAELATNAEPIDLAASLDSLWIMEQLLKALPKMAKAARSAQLQGLLETHLQETEAQVKRLNEGLRILGAPARAKPCKGMAGLVEEGEEVMSEGKKKEDAPADLALIGAAQRVEHYEIAAYTTARNLALQVRQPVLVQLLTTSLGEEQNAGQLLDQVAQPLMSVAKMPASVE
jgi:Mn-containing catalase